MDPAADFPAVSGDAADGGARGATVCFHVEVPVALPPAQAWARLVDWADHGRWVPATTVEVDADDPSRFVARSGWGPLVLVDHMVAVEEHFDGTRGRCRVRKEGPVLVGWAGFVVEPHGDGALVRWDEDVAVRWLPRATPQWAVALVARASARMFASGVRAMAAGPHVSGGS